ncbi:MAG TPA: Asp23/Gls24 family envelope stress response protein [Aldersonia sp.]
MTEPNIVRPTVVPPDQGSGGDPSSLGRTVIADTVVAKIAAIATREIGGVHDLAASASRMVGRLRDTVPGAFPGGTAQGVSVEVGERQAAVDIGIVAYYGVALHELAAAIRRNVIAALERMTGLEVTEVNVTVHDVYLEGEDDLDGDSRPRVQ